MSAGRDDQAAAAGPRRGTSVTLLQRLRANQADAWGHLVHLYTPLLKYWCARWGVVDDDAEDVIQEVFQAVTTGLGTFRRERPEDTFRGWLHAITRNKLLQHLRAAGRQPRAAGGTDALLRLQELADGTAAVADEDDPPGELHALYRRALDLVRGDFEERSWRMFWLTAVEGRTPAEVAAELGTTSGAVRKAKSRVLHRLKEEMGDLIG
jgi:RNA polymerase sigma-70 factor (ECF subfamily)